MRNSRKPIDVRLATFLASELPQLRAAPRRRKGASCLVRSLAGGCPCAQHCCRQPDRWHRFGHRKHRLVIGRYTRSAATSWGGWSRYLRCRPTLRDRMVCQTSLTSFSRMRANFPHTKNVALARKQIASTAAPSATSLEEPKFAPDKPNWRVSTDSHWSYILAYLALARFRRSSAEIPPLQASLNPRVVEQEGGDLYAFVATSRARQRCWRVKVTECALQDAQVNRSSIYARR